MTGEKLNRNSTGTSIRYLTNKPWNPFFVTAFWATVITLGIALLVLCFILTNKSSLQRKGYREEHIKYLRRSHLIRLCSVAVLVPLMILFSAWIVREIAGELTEEAQMAWIVFILFVLVIPVKYLDETINQKWIRKLAFDTNEKVAIDLRFRTLHLIFHPWYELILGIAAFASGVLYLKIEQWVVYLFLIIPFNFSFFFLYFFSHLLIKLQDTVDIYATGMPERTFSQQLVLRLIPGMILSVGWLGRIAIYLANYRQCRAEISGGKILTRLPGGRRVWFFLGSVLVFLMLSGLGRMTNVFRQGRTQVGRVLEKYNH